MLQEGANRRRGIESHENPLETQALGNDLHPRPHGLPAY
jgi:hypothetical protein